MTSFDHEPNLTEVNQVTDEPQAELDLSTPRPARRASWPNMLGATTLAVLAAASGGARIAHASPERVSSHDAITKVEGNDPTGDAMDAANKRANLRPQVANIVIELPVTRKYSTSGECNFFHQYPGQKTGLGGIVASAHEKCYLFHPRYYKDKSGIWLGGRIIDSMDPDNDHGLYSTLWMNIKDAKKAVLYKGSINTSKHVVDGKIVMGDILGDSVRQLYVPGTYEGFSALQARATTMVPGTIALQKLKDQNLGHFFGQH